MQGTTFIWKEKIKIDKGLQCHVFFQHKFTLTPSTFPAISFAHIPASLDKLLVVSIPISRYAGELL